MPQRTPHLHPPTHLVSNRYHHNTVSEHMPDAILGNLVEDGFNRRLRLYDGICTSLTSDDVRSSVGDAILADVQSVQSLLATFTRRVNELRSPIIRLPPELIRLIFEEAALQYRAHRLQVGAADRRCRHWMYLGHVCHSFRSILLDMHALWAGAIFAHDLHGAYQELFRRAHSAPLNIDISFHEKSLEKIEFAKRQLARARGIAVTHADSAVSFAHELTYAVDTFPSLESIELSFYPGCFSDSEPVPSSRKRLPELVDMCAASQLAKFPSLKHLHLSNISIPFSGSSSLTSLSLSLSLSQNEDGFRAPPTPFLDMLRRCPELKELRLINWLPDFTNSSLEHHACISLPHLETSHLDGPRLDVTLLWSLLITPACTDLKVRWSSEDCLADQAKSVEAFRERVVRSDFDAPYVTKLRIRCRGADSCPARLNVCFLVPDLEVNREAATKEDAQDIAYRCILDLSLRSKSFFASDVEQVMARICAVLDLAKIPVLELDGFFDPLILAHFPSVETLALMSPRREDIEHLGAFTPGSHSPDVFVLPQLRKLVLTYGLGDSFYTREARTLSRVLENRKEHDMPIRTLEFVTSEDHLFMRSQEFASSVGEVLVHLSRPEPVSVSR
ncbi:hypothetical protein PENSPDRAFT_284757 [Peniophora sp. CONT]|nr:hypothetical protein PENSPDRAFT_284757 [Peniophora sp. CONT]